MIAKRILALLAAIALVIGAIAVRRSWDDGSRDATTTDGASPTSAPLGAADVACITDLATICAGVTGATVEPWTVTSERLTDDSGPDVWITVAPLDRLMADAGDIRILATTRLVVIGRNGRAEAMQSACEPADFALWRCIGDAAGQSWSSWGGDASWGFVAPGVSDPGQTAFGALALGALSTGYFATPTFSSRDISADDGFVDWYATAVRNVPDAGLSDPLALLLRRPSAVGLTLWPEALVEPTAGSRLGELTVLAPTGSVPVAVVAVTRRPHGRRPAPGHTRCRGVRPGGLGCIDDRPDHRR
ncbi:MAG: hypothetical protein R2705_17780 [Ilumatobacteraceae bacterium]